MKRVQLYERSSIMCRLYETSQINGYLLQSEMQGYWMTRDVPLSVRRYEDVVRMCTKRQERRKTNRKLEQRSTRAPLVGHIQRREKERCISVQVGRSGGSLQLVQMTTPPQSLEDYSPLENGHRDHLVATTPLRAITMSSFFLFSNNKNDFFFFLLFHPKSIYF